ncbi:MAG: SufD family Fe-S cluster assembly protein [Thermoproteus sp.]
MKLAELKIRARELASKLPYQEMADSPGVKHYIDWSRYEGYEAEAPVLSGEAGPCEVSVANGRLVGVGPCRGVEAHRSDEAPLRLIELDRKMNALVAARVPEAIRVRLNGTPEAPVVVRLSARGERAFSAAYLVLEVADGFVGDVAFVVEGSGDVLNSALIEGYIGDDVSLNASIASVSGGGPQYVLARFLVGSRSSVSARPLTAFGTMNSVIEEYVVEGAKSSVEVVGLDVGAGKSKIHHYVSAVNDGEYGRGRVKLLAVAKDEALVVQRALGRITKRGRWSESVAEGVTYIASKTAAAITQPILYVDTGDVEGARHSAADASLDEDKAFYLKSRGFSDAELTELIYLSLIDQYASQLPEGLARPLSPYIDRLRG